MAHITANYKMYLPAGHHRQPRNADTELSLAPTAYGDTPFSPPFFPQLPYTLPASLGGGGGDAKLLFWSDTDGTTGVVRPPQPFDIPSAASARTVTGWYFPISGPGTGGDGGPFIIDDAFSAKSGGFIDDTFVDVTSNPALTADANVVGFVPTDSAQTLVAHGHVTSTTEPFSQWILNDQVMPVGQAALNVPQGTEGIAIAVYQQGEFPSLNLPQYAQWVRVLWGLIADGNGVVIGPDGKPHPVDPGWGTLIARLQASGGIAALSRTLEGRLGHEIGQLAARDALAAVKEAVAAFEKLARE